MCYFFWFFVCLIPVNPSIEIFYDTKKNNIHLWSSSSFDGSDF